MSIRSNAILRYEEKYGKMDKPIYTSKYYTSEESWPKIPVWWFQIPPKALDASKNRFVNLICEAAPGKNEFHYLKVPTKYLLEHIEKFHRIGEIVSLYLSAESKNMFNEVRGKGNFNFETFLVT